MGVHVHFHAFYLLHCTPAQFQGADFTIECLVYVIIDLQKKYKDAGQVMPRKLVVQFDNASDNKAKAVIGFCAMLVESGVFDEVQPTSLIVGHTHTHIDRTFSVLGALLRTMIVFGIICGWVTYCKVARKALRGMRMKYEPVVSDLIAFGFVAYLFVLFTFRLFAQ